MKPVQKLFTACLVVATLALPSMAAAQCVSNGLGVHYLDLKRPLSIRTSTFGNPSTHATMLLGLTPSSNQSCPGWHEALVKVTIPDGCTQANIWVEYEDLPIGWSLNVGDSSGNNGFGGDAGEPDSEAELQVLGETLRVYSSAIMPGTVDLLAEEHLALTDGALEIVVRDQYLSWGQPFTALETPSSQLLFKLPDPDATEPSAFYLGINRVVSGPGDRTGCGVRRVLVSFS